MYRVIWVVVFLKTGGESVTRIAIAQCCTAKYMYTECIGVLLGHRKTRWITIEATLVNRPVVVVDAGVEVWRAGPVLE